MQYKFEIFSGLTPIFSWLSGRLRPSLVYLSYGILYLLRMRKIHVIQNGQEAGTVMQGFEAGSGADVGHVRIVLPAVPDDAFEAADALPPRVHGVLIVVNREFDEEEVDWSLTEDIGREAECTGCGAG